MRGVLLKLTIEISDEILERVEAAGVQAGRTSAVAFIERAVLNELERIRSGRQAGNELADLTAQIQELRTGQKAIIALVDSSATILSALLRGNSGEMNGRTARHGVTARNA